MLCPICAKPATWIGNPYRLFCTERRKGKETYSGTAIRIATCAGLFLFRIFDIVKPFPARRAERAGGGWGIMLDEVAAGGYALGGVILLEWVLK
jgi:phosphatidylglycerophosphatase A